MSLATVETKDITMMQSVADMQGFNFQTKRILKIAANAVCGMVEKLGEEIFASRGTSVGLGLG